MSSPVRVPWRVVTGSTYGDAALAVYVKIAALARRRLPGAAGQRPAGCEAGVAYLSGLLGLSRGAVERALTQLTRPAPGDDVVEVITTRRTLPGGRGQTAVRRPRAAPRAEPFALVPSRAAEALTPRQLRAYAAIAYATATGHPVSHTELGQVLRHRTGARAGQPLGDRSVGRIVTGLEEAGWITVDRRAGYQGRHLYEVHAQPHEHEQLALTDLDEGSGGDPGEGSLAAKEDHRSDSPDAQAGLPIRRRRDTGSKAVENPGNPVFAGFAGQRTEAPPVYRGPGLSLSPRIWRVLQPVGPLLPGLSEYVVRELARRIGRELDQGVEIERLRGRLQHRYASTTEIRDPGRWLLGPAVVRHGCGLTACESGVIWHTGMACEACAELRTSRPQPDPGRHRLPPAPGTHPYTPDRRGACARCDLPAANRRHHQPA
ncbi:hypothetical protein [Actinacidiphila sp. ITFR-21]|uniref:hypothetical protein n=1 Tax=Actinacidiphila sp. ITFR-21 TaxID=3075199 RepID=UPI00288C279A|nr:hypothetical protein [Streptomyces sp. ITFR-21]WNI16642.1 hypothetical protein RLT57_14720 [Streptomyces sp. ITFR-21]